jgi:photosystem II stability/assembly factor-like uncharacterized protein
MRSSRLSSIVLIGLAFAVLFGAATGFAQTPGEEFFTAITYRDIGPCAQGVRFTDFAVPLQQPNTFYAATSSGGLLKSVNNGISYEWIFENEKVISIGDIAVAPSNPNILYLGSGEANSSRSTYWGDGIYKSTDAGKTWKNVGLKETHHIGRIVVHPSNPDVVYVAALGHLYSDNPERGVFITRDGGKTWTKAGFQTNDFSGKRDVGVCDIVMNPNNPDVLYCAAYDKLRKPWTYMIGGPGSAIYKTTDAGRSWKKLGGGLPAGILGRIGLTIYPKNPSILYTVIENCNKPNMTPEQRWQEIVAGKPSAGMIDGEVYRTEDAGATWRKVSPEKQSIGSGPGYYYCDIIIDPNSDKHVYALTVGVQESKDGGKTWGSPFRFGGDNHALWIDPKDSNHMLLGYDHGMGVTFDGGKAWLHPDHLPMAQFYAVDFDMSVPYRVAGGLQDNGSLMGPSSKKGGAAIRFEDWTTVGGGDGMYNVFDRKTNRYLYNESQFGPLSRLDLVTGERKSIAYRAANMKRFNWNAPILVSAHNSDAVYHCGNIVVKSTNRGESWTEISPDLTTNDAARMPDGRGGDGNIQFCTITTIDESPIIPGLLWVGTDDGNVWVTRNDGGSWTKLNDKISGNPGYWISRVAASNSDPGTAYVSYTGLRHDDFRPFLYKTTDYGQTWASIAANLPAEPINVIREGTVNPNLLFAGTDFAVYASLDGGKSWTKMKGNMPANPIYDLKIQPRDHDLIVATHGRGIYIADISALEGMTSEALAKDAFLYAPKAKVLGRETLPPEYATINYSGKSEPAGMTIFYMLKAKPQGDVKIQVYQGALLVNEIAGTANAGLNTVTWDLMKRRALTDDEKKAAAERGARGQRGGIGGGNMAMMMGGGGFGQRGGAVRDPNFAYNAAGAGEYRLVLVVGDQQYAAPARVMDDVVR